MFVSDPYHVLTGRKYCVRVSGTWYMVWVTYVPRRSRGVSVTKVLKNTAVALHLLSAFGKGQQATTVINNTIVVMHRFQLLPTMSCFIADHPSRYLEVSASLFVEELHHKIIKVWSFCVSVCFSVKNLQYLPFALNYVWTWWWILLKAVDRASHSPPHPFVGRRIAKPGLAL